MFLIAYRKRAEFRDEAPVSVWLLGIARNEALLHLRGHLRSKRRTDLLGATLDAWGAEALERQPPIVEDVRFVRLRRCLERLAPGSSSLVAQHYFEGRSLAEIAAARGKREGAVKVMLFRIRQALRACIAEPEAGGP